jgi:hypothetical protein
MLPPGSRSEQRRLVETVDEQLVECARQLVAAARQTRVAKQLAASYPPRRLTVRDVVEVSGEGVQRTDAEQALADVLAIEKSQVQWIAKHGWSDLVCPADYFGPRGGWMSEARGTATPGEFVVAFNPELHPIGDFVSRCLIRRVQELCDTLAEFGSKCFAALRAAGGNAIKRLEREPRAFQALSGSADELTRACLVGPEAMLRDSCIILTQAYAAFGKTPDLSWLALSPADVGGAASIRHRLTHQQGPEVSDRIALALSDLHRLYDADSPQRSPYEEAIASGGLVIDGKARQVFWEGQLVGGNWRTYRTLWPLFVRLARGARLDAPVREQDLYADSGAASKMATNLSRLRQLLPGSLHRRIEPVHGERAYRLRLPGHRIFLF